MFNNNKSIEPYVNSYNNSVVAGVLNPLKRITTKQLLHLDSSFRDNLYYNQNRASFRYTLPQSINDVVSIKLKSINIPNTWYPISEIDETNIFTIEASNGMIYDISLVSGFYTSSQLVNEITNILSNIADLSNISLDYSNITKKFKFSKNGGNDFSIFFRDDNVINFEKTLGWILGFRGSKYLNISEIESEGLFLDCNNRYIYFSLEDFQHNKTNSQIVFFNNSTMNEFILAKVHLTNECKYSDNDYLNIFDKREYFGPIKLSKFNIQLLDKYGELINLNNMDFDFTLEIEILYNKNNSK